MRNIGNQFFTDAHEYGDLGNLGIDSKMDIYNSVGIRLGYHYQHQENWEISKNVQKYVDNGWLYRCKVQGTKVNELVVTNSDYY